MDVMRAAAAREAGGADVLHLEVGSRDAGAAGVGSRPCKRPTTDRLHLGDGHPGPARSHRRPLPGLVRDRSWRRAGGGDNRLVLGLCAGLLAAEVGDRVALAAPGYPAYRNILTALGIEVVDLGRPGRPFSTDAGYAGGLDRPVDGLIIASPANPTGTMIGAADWRRCRITAGCQHSLVPMRFTTASVGAPAVTRSRSTMTPS